MAIPGMAVYNASKYATVGLSAAVRTEFADSGVSVSTILPSAVRTDLASGAPLGKGMPTVDPEDVAEAILDSVGSRRAEIAVPGYLLPGLDFLNSVVPESVYRLARRAIDDRRALTSIDTAARAEYTARVERQADAAPPSGE